MLKEKQVSSTQRDENKRDGVFENGIVKPKIRESSSDTFGEKRGDIFHEGAALPNSYNSHVDWLIPKFQRALATYRSRVFTHFTQA